MPDRDSMTKLLLAMAELGGRARMLTFALANSSGPNALGKDFSWVYKEALDKGYLKVDLTNDKDGETVLTDAGVEELRRRSILATAVETVERAENAPKGKSPPVMPTPKPQVLDLSKFKNLFPPKEQSRPTSDDMRLLAALTEDETSVQEVATKTGKPINAVHDMVKAAKERGLVYTGDEKRWPGTKILKSEQGKEWFNLLVVAVATPHVDAARSPEEDMKQEVLYALPYPTGTTTVQEIIACTGLTASNIQGTLGMLLKETKVETDSARLNQPGTRVWLTHRGRMMARRPNESVVVKDNIMSIATTPEPQPVAPEMETVAVHVGPDNRRLLLKREKVPASGADGISPDVLKVANFLVCVGAWFSAIKKSSWKWVARVWGVVTFPVVWPAKYFHRKWYDEKTAKAEVTKLAIWLASIISLLILAAALFHIPIGDAIMDLVRNALHLSPTTRPLTH